MNQDAVDFTRQHYDNHSFKHESSRAALRERALGPAAPLKKFHNEVKRCLINRFASSATRLLDLACGRGGDIQKWMDAGVKYVKAIDLSPQEIAEAQKRLEETIRRRRNAALMVDFQVSDKLGVDVWKDGDEYDVVSCMFAIHYFCAAECSLKNFLQHVALNLKPGGYFIGTVPDGKEVMTLLSQARSHVYRSPMLQLESHWQGGAQAFGSAYSCSIADTVTEGHGGSTGSFEYLVFQKVLVQLAAQFGLQPVVDYKDMRLNEVLRPPVSSSDGSRLFRHFMPNFPDSDPSLEQASALNAAFVFCKTVDASADAAVARSKPAAHDADKVQAGKRKAADEDAAAAVDAASKRRRSDVATVPRGGTGEAQNGDTAQKSAAAQIDDIAAPHDDNAAQHDNDAAQHGGDAAQEDNDDQSQHDDVNDDAADDKDA